MRDGCPPDVAPSRTRHPSTWTTSAGHFIDLLTHAELDTFADLNDGVLRHLAEEPFPE
jgi:hypothetical protein